MCNARVFGTVGRPQEHASTSEQVRSIIRDHDQNLMAGVSLSLPSLSMVSAHEPGYVCQAPVCSLCIGGRPVWGF